MAGRTRYTSLGRAISPWGFVLCEPRGRFDDRETTPEILESDLNCKYKAHLKLAGQQGNKSDYEGLLAVSRQEVRQEAIGIILARHTEGEVARDIALTAATLRAGPSTSIEDDLVSLRFDGTETGGWAVEVGGLPLRSDAVP